MKRIISLLLAILTVCTLTFGMSGCGNSNYPNKYVGEWVCESWVDFMGEKNNNAKLILKSDGSGTYQPSDEWATTTATWEVNSEDSIMIFYDTTSIGRDTGNIYTYKNVDGVEYLTYDNGKVRAEYIKNNSQKGAAQTAPF